MKHQYKAAAKTSRQYRIKNLTSAAIVFVISCFGLFMCIYSFIQKSWIFGAAYLIAVLLGFSYVVIRCNTVFSTYIATDDDYVYLKNWENDFLPYRVDQKRNRLFAELLPAGTRIMEVPVDDVAFIMLGTKNYIKRYSNNPEFAKAVRPFETNKDFYKKKSVSTADLIYLMTYDGNFCFMPIEGFDPKQVVGVLSAIREINPDVEIMANSKKFRMR